MDKNANTEHEKLIQQIESSSTQSEYNFMKVFHGIPDIMSINNLNLGHYVAVNDAWLEFSGHKREDVIGCTPMELGIWADEEEQEQRFKSLYNHINLSNQETKYRMRTGEIRNFLLSTLLIDLNGEPHLFSVLKDITDRKRMEEALRLSEELFSKAFNTSPIPMSISTLEEGRFINVNESFCRVIGYSHEEIRGRGAIEMGFWLDPQEREEVKHRIKNKESIREMEMYFGKKNKEKRMGLYSAEGIEINGVPCLLSLVVDITERRQMEIEMTRLERLNLVGEVAASLGHEIRNPMTTVRGYLQILDNKEKYSEDKEVFALMIEEIDRANQIISEFLSLTNNDQVKLRLQNLNTIVSSIFPLIQANVTSQDKHVSLIMEDLPNIMMDEKEIRQVLLNLVCNGLEAMAEGGILTIKTFAENEQVVLAIQDQGAGIDEKTLEKLGTPFFTTKEKGTGLGLAVCYRIAARHRAKIEIETGSNGTTFLVKFNIGEVHK